MFVPYIQLMRVAAPGRALPIVAEVLDGHLVARQRLLGFGAGRLGFGLGVVAGALGLGRVLRLLGLGLHRRLPCAGAES